MTSRRWSTVSKVLLAVALALAALVALFDWNWLRRPIRHYLYERSGREVRIDDLHVEIGSFLEPTVRLRGVYVQNARWASKEPLITAREISCRFALSSLWGDNIEVMHLKLVGAKVDMERLADGHRNWRLRKPDDTGPGRVRVMLLEAHDSQVRFVNRAIDLDLAATVSPLDGPSAAAAPYGLTTRVAYSGAYEGHAFSGEGYIPPVISFRATGVTFPAQGHIVSGGTRIEFDGFLTDVFDIGPIDAKVRLTGPSLSRLYPFLRMKPPPSKPFAVEAQLTQAGGVYTFAQLEGRIGSTTLTGDATYDRSGERPHLQATLKSDAATFTDIAPLMAMHGSVTSAGRDEGSKRAFRLGGLRSVDAHIDARAGRLSVEALPPLEDVRVEARLDRGMLELKAVELRVGGGRITGSASFDGRSDTPKAQLTAEMRRASLERLLPAAKERRVNADVTAHLKVSSEGTSASALIGNLRGAFDARLDRGTISNLADAKLGLEFGRVIGIYLRGEREIAIDCAVAAFELRGGVARSRQITFDTAPTRVDGSGTVDLRNDTMDFLLTPEAKKPGLFTRRATLRVHGPIGKPEVTIGERVEQAQARCAA